MSCIKILIHTNMKETTVIIELDWNCHKNWKWKVFIIMEPNNIFFLFYILSFLNLEVSVSNPLSTFSSTLHLSVLDSSTPSLGISVLHGPLGVPSCIPFLPKGFNGARVQAVYRGDTVILQADVGDGPAVQFWWCFTPTGERKNMEGEKAVCLPSSDRLNHSVVSREGKVALMWCTWPRKIISILIFSSLILFF